MTDRLTAEQIRRYAGLELNALVLADVLPPELFEGARVASAGTKIHDLNGEELYRRVVVTKGRQMVGYVDIAAHPALGTTWLAVVPQAVWDAKALLAEATAAARKRYRTLKFDRTRFVAYSYPKIAVQFLVGDQETLLLELGTWQPVPPPSRKRRKPMEPSNFERWSLLDEMPAARKRANSAKLEKRLETWEGSPKIRRFDASLISRASFSRVSTLKLVDTRELHYSSRQTDHATCYELRGQETNVWCVGASTQMLLDFYRYEYTQDRLAQELGLGTKASPNGLSYANVADVVTAIEDMTSSALDATMITNPSWTTFRSEIVANRPLISFIPGHSRTVAGYTRTLLLLVGSLSFRGLLVFDPWPPNAGVITRWENFDAQTYQYAYSAQVTLV